jgi:acetyltransferase-like isoleucine patch superfamily enzyme
MNISSLYKLCKKSDTSFICLVLRFIYYRSQEKLLLLHQRAIVKGVQNIYTQGFLTVGVNYCGFLHKKDVTLLNIQGKMNIRGNVSIGRGCRLDLGEKALLEIGEHSYINPFSMLIIQHGLTIGKNCAISWNCQFLDDDFHSLKYDDKKDLSNSRIVIGDHVWIGSNVFVYKGVCIGNGSVVAANSVVKDRFDEENVLIAGNPARIIRQNVQW